MVNYSGEGCEADLNATFAALSDATRRRIVAVLTRGEASVSQLAEPFAMSMPAVCKHLRVLERARLIETRKTGRVHRCRLRPETMQPALEWIEHQRQFWERRFDALAEQLENPEGGTNA